MGAIVRAMQRPNSGLEVKNRTWLKMEIANAAIGSEVVDWLHANVNGFTDRKEAQKYASQMLKAGYIQQHKMMGKRGFSEHSYYAFGEESIISSGESRYEGLCL